MPHRPLIALTFLLLALAGGCRPDRPPPQRTGPDDARPLTTTSLSGDALKRELHLAVREHRVFNYRQLWDELAYTDEDPARPGHVVLLYTGWSLPASDHGNGRDQWNREHVWAKSKGDFGNRPGPGTDLHLIRPTDTTMNSRRNNLAFDDGGRPVVDDGRPTGCFFDSDSWEPRDAVKGDVARMMFYVAVRYEGGDSDPDLELIDVAHDRDTNDPLYGKLSTLLAWHAADPVDDDERRRNDRIFERQGNRNPFIDRPEYVRLIWGDALR